MYSNWNPHTQLVGKENGTAILENTGSFLKVKHEFNMTLQSHSLEATKRNEKHLHIW